MNDFTKAELLDICFLLQDWYRHEDKEGKAPHDKLFRKIQSMIDNYCEHECNGEVEIFVDTCSKCNDYMLREVKHDNQ